MCGQVLKAPLNLLQCRLEILGAVGLLHLCHQSLFVQHELRQELRVPVHNKSAVCLRVEACKRSLIHKDNVLRTMSSDSQASGLEDCLEQAARPLGGSLSGLSMKVLVDGKEALKPGFGRTLDPKLMPHSRSDLHGRVRPPAHPGGSAITAEELDDEVLRQQGVIPWGIVVSARFEPNSMKKLGNAHFESCKRDPILSVPTKDGGIRLAIPGLFFL